MNRSTSTRNRYLLARHFYGGMTLVEVLVGACIFAIAIAGISGAMRQGSRLILDAENKKKAYTDAQSILEEFLTYSYTAISAEQGEPHAVADTGCTYQVTETVMAAAGGLSDIPYCTVRVVCAYDNDEKQVALSGIIPYPLIEVFTRSERAGAEVTAADQSILSFTFDPAGRAPGDTTLDPVIRVRSDLLVFYDISFRVQDNLTPVLATDQVFSSARISNDTVAGGQERVGAETATAILTQPALNNSFVVRADQVSVERANTIDIMWRRTNTPGGDIVPRWVNLVIIRIERNQ